MTKCLKRQPADNSLHHRGRSLGSRQAKPARKHIAGALAGENGVAGLPASRSPAVAAEIPQDLQAIIDAWPDLPEAIKAGILAMVQAAGGNAGQDR